MADFDTLGDHAFHAVLARTVDDVSALADVRPQRSVSRSHLREAAATLYDAIRAVMAEDQPELAVQP